MAYNISPPFPFWYKVFNRIGRTYEQGVFISIFILQFEWYLLLHSTLHFPYGTAVTRDLGIFTDLIFHRVRVNWHHFLVTNLIQIYIYIHTMFEHMATD